MTARRALLLASLLLASASTIACGPSNGSQKGPDITQPVEVVHTTPRVCAETLADYCAGSSCLTTWTTADDTCMNAEPGDVPLQYTTGCGQFLILSQGGTTAYYDASSQALVAVADSGGNCLAGPANFALPEANACPLTTCGIFSCGGPDGGPDGAM